MFRYIKNLIQTLFNQRDDFDKVFDDQVLKLIFIHLSGSEILQCSLVSKRWHEVIASEPLLTDRLKIVIIEPYFGMLWRFDTRDAIALVNSKRHYRHIAIYTTRNFTNDHLLLMATFHWTSVLLYNHTFKSEIELTNFLGLMEPTIESLDLRNIRIVVSKKQQIASSNLIFPALKTLKVMNCNTYIHSELFKNVENLEHLELESASSPSYDDDPKVIVERIRAVQWMLVKNVQIQKLKLFIHQKDFDNMFIDERFLSRLRFRLVDLSIKKFRKMYERETNIVQMNNFGKFLTSQKDSLRSLHLLEWIGNECLELAINTLDKLRVLSIENLECYGKDDSIANMNLFKNESIEVLCLHARHSKFCELQKVLLGVVPNLKELTIGTVNQQVLDTLIDKTTKLERLNMDYFTAYIVPDQSVLHYLKTMNFHMSYAQNFRDQLRGQSYYTNFEAVFLRAARRFENKLKRNSV